MKLFLHIGCHKTGTTSIQHTLAANEPALKEQGLVFFYETPVGEKPLPDLHSWLDFVEPNRVVARGFYLREPQLLAEKLARLKSNVIISSENFSFFFEQKNIETIYRHLAPVFQEIKIICYLRRQDRHIISHHQEGSKIFREAEYDLFGHSTKAIPNYIAAHRLYLDYAKRLSMWARVFGWDNMIIRQFDRKLLKNGDAASDFFELIGVDGYRKINERNISLGLREAKYGHLINGTWLRNKQYLANILNRENLDTTKLMPSREEAISYYQNFSESNKKLSDKIIFDEDFSDYSLESEDTWNEERSNQAILKILNIIDVNYAELPADDSRDAAMAIGETNPTIAIKLLKIALFLRPDAQMIMDKIAYFRDLRQKQGSK
jgi:hypothetical protein